MAVSEYSLKLMLLDEDLPTEVQTALIELLDLRKAADDDHEAEVSWHVSDRFRLANELGDAQKALVTAETDLSLMRTGNQNLSRELDAWKARALKAEVEARLLRLRAEEAERRAVGCRDRYELQEILDAVKKASS